MRKKSQHIGVKGSAKLPFIFADFTARNEVHIETEFHAESGSEVHIYTSDIFPECSDYDTSHLNFRVANNNSSNSNEEKNIELSFELQGDEYEILPNPNDGKFTISAIENNLLNVSLEITIFDLIGQKVQFQKFNAPPVNLNISYMARGVYLIKIYDGTNSYFKKIIYQ